MPLLRKQPFKRIHPAKDLRPEEEVFFCEATKEVFRDYDEFFQRTILCNSLVWSCEITGKAGLTYEEAVESERKARKRLGAMPKALKRGLLWVAAASDRRGRLADLVDDAYVFAAGRYFIGETLEAVVGDLWCDCEVLEVIPPTEDEIKQDAEEEKKEEEERKKENEGKEIKKEKKSFFPPEHLFKYKVKETDPDDPEKNDPVIVEIEDIRRDKSSYTREKNLLFLKTMVELGKDNNFVVKKEPRERFKLNELKFTDIFAGPEPKFQESKRLRNLNSSSSLNHHSSKSKSKNHQGTLDSWMKNDQSGKKPQGSKKQTAAELEAEMRRIRENNARFKEDMKKRVEDARKKRLEDKAKEKERKKEETKLVRELMNEWKKRREDLECDDLKELPKPKPVRCGELPNRLFGDCLSLMEFVSAFRDLLEADTNLDSKGLTLDALSTALTDQTILGGPLYNVLQFLLFSLFDLQDEEDEEVKLDKLTMTKGDAIDKAVLGRDEDVARHIKAATEMAHWSARTQGGQKMRNLQIDEWSITEVLRLHLESAGAFRSEKLNMWLYQQRGGYRLHDDPGLTFRMEEPQILDAMKTKTVYELLPEEKLKILICLMQQILTYASVRDVIDDRFAELGEAKLEYRAHTIEKNKQAKAKEEAEKQKRKEEKLKKEETVKEEEDGEGAAAHLTERQRLAIQSKKEREEMRRQTEAFEKESSLVERIRELQTSCGITFLGRDRAYRRFWMLETLPGLFVEHDDDTVGTCLPTPTPRNPYSRPLEEAEAIKQAKEILDAREKDEKSSSASSSSDKENEDRKPDVTKSYNGGPLLSQQQSSPALVQKVLSAKNGSLDLSSGNPSIKEEPMEVDQKNVMPWGCCIPDADACTVHSTILPRTHWAYFSTVEELDQLVAGLNERGIREAELKERLSSERSRLEENIRRFQHNNVYAKLSKEVVKEEQEDKDEKQTVGITSALELQLRDLILELEEKIYHGNLGMLKIKDRLVWQQAIQDGGFDRQCEALYWGGGASSSNLLETPAQSTKPSPENSRSSSPVPENKRDSSGSCDSSKEPQETLKKVRGLASAVLQIAQMVDEKYIKSPLGEDEKDKKKRLREEEKKRRDEESENRLDTSTSSSTHILTPFEEWENSLMSSTSFAQVYLHMTTLESSVIWSKSLLNTRCRLCRKKNNPEKMLLCDGCDKGHHMYCLKPELKAIPKGDWYCDKCKPLAKKKLKSPVKKARKVFNVDDDEVQDDDQNVAEEAEEEAEEEDADKSVEVEEEEDTNESDDEDTSGEREDDDDDEMPLGKRRKRAVAVAPKKAKKNDQTEEATGKKKGTISMLLGKRKCATEANEKIARVAQESHSGHSSGNEELPLRGTRSRPARGPGSSISSSRLGNALNGHESVVTSNSDARSKRRRAVDDELDSMFNPTALEDFLNAMMKHRDGWPFDRPITKADAPDYHKIIQRPMDLGTIRSGINRMKYSCNQEVMEDIKQVFINCYIYNKEEAEEYQCGVRLEKYFKKEARKMGLLHEENGDLDEMPKNKKKKRTTL